MAQHSTAPSLHLHLYLLSHQSQHNTMRKRNAIIHQVKLYSFFFFFLILLLSFLLRHPTNTLLKKNFSIKAKAAPYQTIHTHNPHNTPRKIHRGCDNSQPMPDAQINTHKKLLVSLSSSPIVWETLCSPFPALLLQYPFFHLSNVKYI